MNRRLGVNMCLLGRVHMAQDADEDGTLSKERRRQGVGEASSKSKTALSNGFWDEARRYMRYATAVYGQSMIRAADLDARGRVRGNLGRVTKEAIGHHVSVPPDDIVLLDVDYDGDGSHLRHFVAVDHAQKKVVLSIRGTFNLAEIVLDVAGFTKDFCGGEAHSEMATMAERVWNVAGPTVRQLLERNQDYEFIITGHSLGAGAACLLTILLEAKDLLPRKQKCRCFAYAPPPVYTPLEFAPKAVRATTSFVHENDAVPSLSVHTVRRLLSDLRAVDDEAHNHMTSTERYKVVLGMVRPPEHLVEAVLESKGKNLQPKQGAPSLCIPSEKTVWLKQDNEKDNGEYRYEIVTPTEWMRRGIRVNPDMLLDHFPPRYEHALDHIEDS
jgi:Lipase (class 3)